MKTNGFHKFLAFLTKLETDHIAYTLAHYREDAVMVTISIPGERWEAEFFEDGSVEVEKFVSDGEIYEENSLQTLFERDTEQETESIPFSHHSEVKVAAL